MSHSFEIKFDEDIEPETLFIRANLSEVFTPEEREAFLGSVREWSEEDCSGEIYLDDSQEWYRGSEGMWVEIFTDFLRLEGSHENAFRALWKRFDAFPKISSVMVGSGNEIWPLSPEEE